MTENLHASMIDVIQPCVPALRRYARSLLRDATTADDLVQDCLERAVNHWHERRNANARTWLFTILHNLGISHLRQRRRRGLHVEFEEDGAIAPTRVASQEHKLRHAELLRALGNLSEEHRAVLLLVSVEDMSYAEAATVLGVPVGTVMSRLSRARERLSALLEPVESTGLQRSLLRRLK